MSRGIPGYRPKLYADGISFPKTHKMQIQRDNVSRTEEDRSNGDPPEKIDLGPGGYICLDTNNKTELKDELKSLEKPITYNKLFSRSFAISALITMIVFYICGTSINIPFIIMLASFIINIPFIIYGYIIRRRRK